MICSKNHKQHKIFGKWKYHLRFPFILFVILLYYTHCFLNNRLQLGVRGSEARHTSTIQYYRDMKKKNDALDIENKRLQEHKAEAEQELKRAKKEVQTEKLKGAATIAAINIAESVGSLFGSNKVKVGT